MALLAALAAYPAAAAGHGVPVLVGIGAAACGLTAVALAFRWWLVVAWGLASFGAEYAVFLRLRGGAVDARAPLVAAGVLVVAELAFDSIAPERGSRERSLLAAELVALLGAALVTVVAAALVLVVAGSARSGLALEAAGAVAAIGVLAVLVRAVRAARY
ncbi:MAG TPA: hypothetical protein VE269_07530 [Gaiellaceae bacterium]|nr:hypothetical protein [Gaiellaceae bacterium]